MDAEASCYWHSIFAHACALTDADLPQKYTKWRDECKSVFGQCGAGTVYEECPRSCLNSCSERDDEDESNSVCKQQCLAGKIYLEWIVELISKALIFVVFRLCLC
jgi:hypothetical protein